MGSLSKRLALSRRERWLLVQSLVALPLIGLGLRLLGFVRWRQMLARLAAVDHECARLSPELTLDRANQTARMVRIAGMRGLYRGKCLPQSLTLWWLLRRQNVESEIRLGARREDGRFEAHAWVELRGIVLDDGPLAHQPFTPGARATADAEMR